MARTVYALVVGIDKYPAPVPPLAGCVNDIEAFESFLHASASTEGAQIQVRKLLDQQATRANIIAGFIEHLSRAGSDDIAVFYYSGHGSQEFTPPEFSYLEPDGLDETLVCYDSRQPGQYDLADKELAKLIAHVSRNNPHVLVVLDACHSGSGTRAVSEALQLRVRHAPADTRLRDAKTFLVTPHEVSQLGAQGFDGRASKQWLLIPNGRHVVLSACQDDEEARETWAEGQIRGCFSSALMQAVQSSGDAITYRDVFKRTSALVRLRSSRQSPVIHATNVQDLDRPWLGGAIGRHAAYFTVSYDRKAGWLIDGGAVHGIAPVTENETTVLRVFPFGTSSEALADVTRAIGLATVSERHPGKSRVVLTLDSVEPDPELTYKAVIVSLPIAPLGVQICGEAIAVARLCTALTDGLPGRRSIFTVQESKKAPELRVTATQNGYTIARIDDTGDLVSEVSGTDDASVWLVVERLEHIARWLRVAALDNPASALPRDAVALEVFTVDDNGNATRVSADLAQQPIRLNYHLRDGERIAPRFRLRVTNRSARRLFCLLLDLPDTFGIFTGLLSGWIEPGCEAWATFTNSDGVLDPNIPLTIPDHLIDQGKTELQDILALIASTEECDPALLYQDDLDVRYVQPPTASRGVAFDNTLQNMLGRVQSRHAGQAQARVIADWISTAVTLVVHCPHDGVAIPPAGEVAQLLPGVSVLGHPAFRATARLASSLSTSRDPTLRPVRSLPPWLVDDPTVVQPFALSTSRGQSGVLDVLQIEGFTHENAQAVTSGAPLQLRVAAQLAANEHVLPVSLEGEFILPLGWSESHDGQVTIHLERLPDPNARSLLGAICIYFKKVVSERLGTAYTYPLLTMTRVEEGKLLREPDEQRIRASVATAKKIVLYVHGIIGDTERMAFSAYSEGVPANVQPLGSNFDLVLAFDYENLNTSIEQTARDLKQRLESVGLGSDHGKTLCIVAHSMGGLAARWFIEREGGYRVVQHLVMLGTPNGGSPWPKVADWATMLMSFGLNGLARAPWPPTTLGYLARIVSKVGALAASRADHVQVALAQMAPRSAFINELANNGDPGTRYSMIAGNTSLIPLDTDPGQDSSKLQRLLGKLDPSRMAHEQATLLAFFGEPNDIAASVQAIRAIPSNHTPSPTVDEVACDHLTYFTTEAGLVSLATLMQQDE